MSQPLPASPAPDFGRPAPAAAPTWFDHLLLLCGCGISLFLTELSGVQSAATPDSPAWMSAPLAAVTLPMLMLPVGVILWWPVFFALTRRRGRGRNLSTIEWIWGALWMLDLFLILALLLYPLGGLPHFLDRDALRDWLAPLVRLTVLTLAGIALTLAVLGRWLGIPRPWTHQFGLAMLIWPVVPLLLIWLGRVNITL